MPVPISAPNVSTYASRSPYITPREYLASPTGVDVSELTLGGNDSDNEDALAQTIARASSWIDTFCRKVLAATLDTHSGLFRVQRDGTIKVPLPNTPILEVVGASTGATPSTISPLADLSNVWIDRKVATIPLSSRGFGSFGIPHTGKVFAVVQYVNGFANCLLTADASIEDTTITVDSALGVFPGLQMTVYDPGASETVFVASVDGNVITLAEPLQNDHEAGINVSALPPAVKQAAVLKTSALIKTRGSDSYVMPLMGAEPTQTTVSTGGGSDDEAIAADLLGIYRRVQ